MNSESHGCGLLGFLLLAASTGAQCHRSFDGAKHRALRRRAITRYEEQRRLCLHRLDRRCQEAMRADQHSPHRRSQARRRLVWQRCVHR